MQDFIKDLAVWDSRARQLLNTSGVTIGRNGWGDIDFTPEPRHGTREHAAMQLVSVLHMMQIHSSGTDRAFLHLTLSLGAALQRLNWIADAMEGQKVKRDRSRARSIGTEAAKRTAEANREWIRRQADDIRRHSPTITDSALLLAIHSREKKAKRKKSSEGTVLKALGEPRKS